MYDFYFAFSLDSFFFSLFSWKLRSGRWLILFNRYRKEFSLKWNSNLQNSIEFFELYKIPYGIFNFIVSVLS